MPRRSRVVLPGQAHHLTQRGTRRSVVFLHSDDYVLYLELVRERARRHGVTIWAYCLLPNHVHLIAAPDSGTGLGRAFGEAHRLYATRINRREGWSGHLWQQRFYSVPLDERHLNAATRYVLRNPVRSGLCGNAIDWPWSSAKAHLGLETDSIIDPDPLAARRPDWSRILQVPSSADEVLGLRQATRAGFWPTSICESRGEGSDSVRLAQFSSSGNRPVGEAPR